MEPSSDQYESFLMHFTRDQFRVLAYIRALIHDHATANDVFQETSLVLWRSFGSFEPSKEFAPWALGVARHQVLKYWRSRDRDRHVFSESLLEQLSAEAIKLSTESESKQHALDECVNHLSPKQKDLVRQFYGDGTSAQVIADQWSCSVHAVYKALKVMRRTLHKCVERRLAA